uniref:Uncharacterized protein n=1 Tax=Lepeophtheirus salmonis TaxID=72036 RepID=A0A0K2TA75_LEPSM
MPLPNYGYNNEETKQNQELIFEMPPKIVESNEGCCEKNNRKKAQITTGKLGIELERKMVINNEDPDNIWKSTNVNPEDLESAKKYSETKDIRDDVKKDLDGFISSNKLKEIRSNRHLQPAPTPLIKDTTTDMQMTTPSYSYSSTKEPLSSSYSPKREPTFPLEVSIPVQREYNVRPYTRENKFTSPSGFAVSSHTYSVQQTRQSINIQPAGTYSKYQTNTYRLN